MTSNYTAKPGPPCWYELGTSDIDGAAAFYSAVLGWTVQKAGGDGFDYGLAHDADGNGVAGLMSLSDQEGTPPPNWVFYLEVADADDAARAVTSAGGSVLKVPADIPGVGRFAVVADPQGAAFAIMAPRPPEEPPSTRAFAPERAGHGSWHELTTTEPDTALGFYEKAFGWSADERLDMGEHGHYQLFRIEGDRAGGIMGLMENPQPVWLSYFTVDSVDAAIERARAAGGQLAAGPNEAPGGIFTAVLVDPQGAAVGISGGK